MYTRIRQISYSLKYKTCIVTIFKHLLNIANSLKDRITIFHTSIHIIMYSHVLLAMKLRLIESQHLILVYCMLNL